MGQREIPSGSLIALDADIIIYAAEKIPPYDALPTPLWTAAQTGEVNLHGSELLILETLVKPLLLPDAGLVNTFEQLLTNSELRLKPITREVLRDAARLRAEFGLKAPVTLLHDVKYDG